MNPTFPMLARGALSLSPILFFSAPVALATRAAEFEVVARIKLLAPSIHEFTLRATVPVPAFSFPREDGASPFRVRGPEGALARVQTEIVSRYAAAEQGADVVEILAQVLAPAGTEPGTPLVYELLLAPHQGQEFEPSSRVATLLETPASVTLRSSDVFGNRYEADLLHDIRTASGEPRGLRNGPWARQLRTHEWLEPEAGQPSGPPDGSLPHLMGVHAYITLHAERDYLLIDLRVHNAGSGNDQRDIRDNPLDEIFFDRLELRVPVGWTVLTALGDPFLGEQVVEEQHVRRDIVTALPEGKLHVMPWQSQFHRRIAIAGPGAVINARAALEEEGLGFVIPGQAPSIPGQAPSIPGQAPTSGEQLYSWWNPETARYFPQRHRLPELDEYLSDCPSVPGCCDLCCDPAERLAQLIPTVEQMGLAADYRAVIGAFRPTDPSHLIRATRRAKVLAWLGNDALSKDDLAMTAELCMMSYSILPQSPSGDVNPLGMLAARRFVDQFPADGLEIHRGTGWMTDTMAAAYSLGDREWRAEALTWFVELTLLLKDGQTACTGVLNACPNPEFFGGLYRTRQAISQAILDNALWGVRSSVFDAPEQSDSFDALTRVLEASTRSMILDDFWNQQAQAPLFQAAAGPFDPADGPSWCGLAATDGREDADTSQSWCTLAYGYELTGDPEFIVRATRMAWGDLYSALHYSCGGTIENRAALLALMQELGW